jgi:hypothetical protein
MFKAGDKVVVVNSNSSRMHIGEVFTILNTTLDGFVILKEFEEWEHFKKDRFVPISSLLLELL